MTDLPFTQLTKVDLFGLTLSNAYTGMTDLLIRNTRPGHSIGPRTRNT